MVLAIILAIIGIGATVFIAHIYAVRASKEQAQQYGSIIKKYQETQGRLLNILGDMLDIVAQSNPQLAARAQEEGDRIRKTDKNLRSFIAFDVTSARNVTKVRCVGPNGARDHSVFSTHG